MERPEAQDSGSIILSGLDPDVTLNSIAIVIREHEKNVIKQIPSEYQVSNTSWRVLKLIQGLTHLSNKWDGVV